MRKLSLTNLSKILLMVLIFNIIGYLFVYSQNADPAGAKDKIQIDRTKTIVEKVPWDKIEKYRNSKAFDYSFKLRKGANFWTRFLMWLNDILEAIFSKKGAAPFIRLIVILLIFGFFIYKILGANISGIFTRNKKMKSSNGFDYFDEDIHSQDLDRKLSQAVAEQNYRDAIRYYYLKLLKHLDLGGLIQWKISKTNLEYQTELVSHKILDDFKALSGIYEYTWYGNFSVDQEHFNNWQSNFLSAIRIADQN